MRPPNRALSFGPAFRPAFRPAFGPPRSRAECRGWAHGADRRSRRGRAGAHLRRPAPFMLSEWRPGSLRIASTKRRRSWSIPRILERTGTYRGNPRPRSAEPSKVCRSKAANRTHRRPPGTPHLRPQSPPTGSPAVRPPGHAPSPRPPPTWSSGAPGWYRRCAATTTSPTWSDGVPACRDSQQCPVSARPCHPPRPARRSRTGVPVGTKTAMNRAPQVQDRRDPGRLGTGVRGGRRWGGPSRAGGRVPARTGRG
jgi:hypothetical protein